MKMYYYNKYDRESITFYTQELIKYLAKKNGHEVVDNPYKADFAGLSLAHHSEVKDILKLRKELPKGIPIIAGGHATYAPKAIAAYADYVCLGHGFEFFRDTKEMGSVKEIEQLPYIYFKGKTAPLLYSQYIDWKMIPLSRTGKNTWAFFWSVGCRAKCNFCATSWTNQYQQNPNEMHLQMARDHTHGKQLYVVTNDYSFSNVRRAVSDVMVKEYIKTPSTYDNIGLIRTGIESVTEKGRYFFGKHIKDHELQRFFELTYKHKKETNLFFIAGVDTTEEYIDFAEKVVGVQPHIKKPRLSLIVNYFNPNIGTPLEDFDLTKLKIVDIKTALFYWRRTNARLRIYRSNAIKPFSKIEQTLKERASTRDELERIFKLEKMVFDHLNGGFQKYIDKCDDMGLGGLLRGDFEKLDITFPYAEKMEKKKEILQRKNLI